MTHPIIDQARAIASAAAGQVCNNDDAKCVQTLVERLAISALAAAEERGRSEERERIRFDMIVGLRHWFNDRYGKWITFKSAKTLATYVFKERTP